jgi:uncharacterized protein (TIGR02646 family)
VKYIPKGLEPEKLANYKTLKPYNTWPQFARVEHRRLPVQDQLKEDQGWLCAYCEIDLIDKTMDGDADFRVEHFHPKSDTTSGHNWHLDWQNLLGCCHGGSQSTVADSATRFTSPDTSCDVPKGDKNLDGIILNPRHIPASPALFSCSRSTGELSVLAHNCQAAGVSVEQAEETIQELNLNAPRLNRLRKQVLNELNKQLRTVVEQGEDVGLARKKLARVHLSKNQAGRWQAFFTAIRSYLGSDAELHLEESGYQG